MIQGSTVFNKWKKKPGQDDDPDNQEREIPLVERDKRKKVEEHFFFFDAITAYEDGFYDQSVRQLEIFTSVVPDHPFAHLYLARAYLEMCKYKKAIDALFNHLRLVDRDSIEANIYLGVAYFEMKEIDMARERFDFARKLGRNSLLVRENLAITKYESGRLEEALDDFIGLHKEEPDNPVLNGLISLCLGKLGKWDIAKSYAVDPKTNMKRFPLY